MDFFMSFRGFLYVLSWISLCPIALTIRIFTGFFSVCNQVGNQESNQESNQVYLSRNNATIGRWWQKGGACCPTPRSAQMRNSTFCLHKILFQRRFCRISEQICWTGALAPLNEIGSSIFSVFCSGNVSRRCESETLYLVVASTTLSAKNP